MDFVGAKLEHLLKIKKLTLVEVEKITGINQSILSDLKNGKTKKPRNSTVQRLCKGLDVDEQYFFLETSVLPADLMPVLPPDIEEFIAQSESMPYLVLAKEIADSKVPVEVVERVLEALRYSK